MMIALPDAVATEFAREKIAQWCAEAGFPVADVRLEGDVLVLVPEKLETLPDVHVLQRLAEQIRTSGYRYVAFAVEPEVTAADV